MNIKTMATQHNAIDIFNAKITYVQYITCTKSLKSIMLNEHKNNGNAS